jgi:hypothetical protein
MWTADYCWRFSKWPTSSNDHWTLANRYGTSWKCDEGRREESCALLTTGPCSWLRIETATRRHILPYQSWARLQVGAPMGPLGKIASFFKNVPLENSKSGNKRGKTLVYSNVSGLNSGATFHRRSSGWSSLRLSRSIKGGWVGEWVSEWLSWTAH